jgi:FtsZ family, C-terminal domain.
MRPARKIAWQGFEKMTNRRTDEDRPDPVTELTAWLRRDGLTDEEIQRLVVKMGKMVAGSAVAEGDERAVRAARAAISQLPAGAPITEARGIMVDVAGAGDLTDGG